MRWTNRNRFAPSQEEAVSAEICPMLHMRRELANSFEELCEILHEGLQCIVMNTVTDIFEFSRRRFTSFVVWIV